MQQIREEETPMNLSGYSRWCEKNGCTHGHCPYECEHPQPFEHPDGNLYCGKCWHDDRELTEMVPCVPEICD